MSMVKKTTDLRPFYSNLFDDFLNSGILPYSSEDRGSLPALNVKEDDKELTLELRVPGLKKEDIKLEYKNGFLTLSGEKKEEKEEKEEKGKYLRREFSSFSFHRTIELPEDRYNVAEAKASYKNGILEVTMPKNEAKDKLHKTIEVK